MSTETTTRNATTKLGQLRTTATEAAASATAARASHRDRQIAVATAEKELRAAYASRTPNPKETAAKEEAHAVAEAKLSDRAFLAQVEGLADAQRHAEAEVSRHVEQNFAQLVEELRPAAEAAAKEIEDRITDLRAALAGWYAIDQQISSLARHARWFKPQRLMPNPACFDKLNAGLADMDRRGSVPVPMPRSLENPAEEQQRLTAAHAAAHPETQYRRVRGYSHKMGG